jgi:hypothetical protein
MPTRAGKQRPTLLQALSLTAAGTVVGLYGLRDAVAFLTGPENGAQLGPLIALSAGALMFAVGGMLLLVVLARPLFAKRPQDEQHDRTGEGAPRL